MSTIDYLFTNTMYLFFPLTIYFIVLANIKNLDLEEKNIFLEVALYTSIYLLFKSVNENNYIYMITLLNMPLLLAYLNKRLKTSIIISVSLIVFLHITLNVSTVLLIPEYILYFLIYFILSKRNKININNIYYPFVTIRTFFITFHLTYYVFNRLSLEILISDILIAIVILLVISYAILSFFKKCEGIIDYNSTLNTLNREKEIKLSLFKITHEIKNPLAVCRGYLDMMKENDYKNYQKYIPIINSEINRTLLLMDDFLDYTKLKINKEDVDIVYLIEELENDLKPLLKKNKIELEFNIPDDEIYLDLDYFRIKQVLINVIKNSIEAKSNNPKISLEIKQEQKNIKIIISDNGVGMDDEVLKRIGENFYTTKERGTGLGVSLSKEIIRLHGGEMNYESELGKGTTVFITLPQN